MEVRAAAPSDLAALPAIEVAAGEMFRAIGMDAIADDAPPTIDDLEAATAIWVAVEHDQVLGYAWIELVDDHAHLEQLSVLPDRGGQGIGTALIDAVVGWAHARGDAEVTLTTFRDVDFNAPLYAKRGFVELPEHEWTPGIQALVATETTHGLDPTTRVVMRRPTH